MMPTLSTNTQAILLLTAPLIFGKNTVSVELLTHGEYKRLARHLIELQQQPADLILPNADALLRACQPIIDEQRLKTLLNRGFLLSQAIEHWQARGIWVISRADTNYPRQLKTRLRENAPAILYGCGDHTLLESGGLAVIGSRHIDQTLLEYTAAVGQLTAQAGKTLISGGAQGVDETAMYHALEAGGTVCGVLANSLEKAAMHYKNRNSLRHGKLVLISPYDPNAGFHPGHAMQRNKLIYALADAALVVDASLEKGGTWNGAIEQLDKFAHIPVFVRSTGKSSEGLNALQKKGALAWPNPHDPTTFQDIFNTPTQPLTDANVSLDLFPTDNHTLHSNTPTTVIRPDFSPAERLFDTVRTTVQRLLITPMTLDEIADAFDVSKKQAQKWLDRLVAEKLVEKQQRPIRYVIASKNLFDDISPDGIKK